MAGFYEKLNYSFGNEDWLTEQHALQIKPQDSVVCITASGDRPLNLLTSPCKEMLALDANPTQNYLLDLKRAALQELDFDDYLAFMGIHEHPKRDVLFKKIKNHLDSDALEYWLNREKAIKNGVIYQGSLERMLFWVSKAIRLLRGTKIEQLFSFDDLEAQRAFLKSSWETTLWKKSLITALHPSLTRLFVKDPGLYLTVDPTITPGTYIHKRMHTFLSENLAKESLLLSLLFMGKVGKEAYSPHLKREGVEQIRKNIGYLSFKTAHIVDYLEGLKKEQFDCYSLSDVASYLTRPSFERLIIAMLRTARPNARFCMRQLLSCHQIPEKLAPYFKRDPILEEKLQREDRCFVYRFVVGTIVK